MAKTKLNSLALLAAKDESSLWEIKAIMWPMIEKVFESIWHKVHRIANIEAECERSIEDAVRSFDPTKGDFTPFLKRKLYRTKLRLLQETARLKRKIDFVDVDEVDVYDDHDGVASVITRITVNEKIARLATDDRRIWALRAWSYGFTDTTDLARRMSEVLGGTTETNRKFITRFKADCRNALSDVS